MATVNLLSSGPAIALEPGMTLRLEAIHPTTGAAVGGVTISNVTIEGEPDTTGPEPILEEPYRLVFGTP